ncbi:MAG: ABC transporter permease [Alphaproteobacteria bacterium]
MATTAGQGSSRALHGLIGSNLIGLVLVTALFVLLFSTATDGFLSKFHLYSMGRIMAVDIVIGFSMMVVLVTGGLNLAVGAIGVGAAMFAGFLMEVVGLPILPALALTLAFGALLGAVNGLAMVLTGVHSFVITLATMSIYFGAMTVLTKAEPFNQLPQDFTDFAKIKMFGFVSPLLLVMLAAGLLLGWLFKFTALGREMLAAGANERAATLSGVRAGRMFVYCHTLSGALAALAGLMVSARNGAALPSMAGQIGADWLLPAFLAPVIGGTLLTGGFVSVTGTALGAILVTVLSSGLLLLQVGEFWVQAFLGLILLVAVVLDRVRNLVAERRRVAAR